MATATVVTMSSESGMSRATISPASAAATTPVSRVQAMKTISSRDQPPATVGPRQRRTASGRANTMSPIDDDDGGREVVPDRAPRQVRPEGDEDEHDDHLGDGLDEEAHVPLVLRVHAESEPIHVPDDQPGEERTEISAPSRRVGREVSDGDDGDDCDRGRLLPNACATVGHDE